MPMGFLGHLSLTARPLLTGMLMYVTLLISHQLMLTFLQLGPVFLTDWAHTDAFSLWSTVARFGAPPAMENGLINGKNTFNVTDTDIIGSRSEFIFETGTSYLLRVVNTATDG